MSLTSGDVVLDQGSPRFERSGHVAPAVKPQREDVVGSREGAIDIAVHLLHVDDVVVVEFLVKDWRVCLQGLLSVGHNRERIPVDVDEIDGVLRNVARFGDDHGKGLANVADLVDGEAVLGDLLDQAGFGWDR